MNPKDPGGIIPPHGGYEDLKSFQMATIVYDATIKFCDRFIDKRSRTHDQMVQAARSGQKNIAEGSQVSGTSKKMELKLVGVARASLEELKGDYEDFLRQRGLPLWTKDDPSAKEVRRLAYVENRSYLTYRTYVEEAAPEVAANTMLCMVHQTNFLLDQQLRQLDQAFLKDGGITERIYQKRQQARQADGSGGANGSNRAYTPNRTYRTDPTHHPDTPPPQPPNPPAASPSQP